MLSAALTTFGGVFYAQFIYFVDPITFLSPMLFIEVILFTAVGGMGTLWGPIVGALLLTPIGEILRGTLGATNPGVDGLLYGIIFVVIILLMPHGIVSARRTGRPLLRRFFSLPALRPSNKV
jgi:branched-chain amino acid transport system permease protein